MLEIPVEWFAGYVSAAAVLGVVAGTVLGLLLQK